ncbi:hypothetical protein D3C85_1597820 [compost metagenome]
MLNWRKLAVGAAGPLVGVRHLVPQGLVLRGETALGLVLVVAEGIHRVAEGAGQLSDEVDHADDGRGHIDERRLQVHVDDLGKGVELALRSAGAFNHVCVHDHAELSSFVPEVGDINSAVP